MTVKLPKNYRPSEKEEYMCERQLEYFKQKLIDWRRNLLRGMARALTDLQESDLQEADINDRATKEIEQALAMKARDRDRKLIEKINAALDRIEDGTYGYCLETGDPIGVLRLEARPTATLCIEAQERHERRERTQAPRD
ncbi:MAG: RNA polymerase-binding protein DksA [Alphaproteobacteria bacterium]|nr:RNA polymerase-binding protein DksA [Alphaproteobacteria bacterium]